jgi:hypothetical protein
MMEHQGS